jgi:hypothetical protein
VPDPSRDKPVVRRAVFALEPARRRQVLEILWYIDALHHHIDPDMYRIELDEVKNLQRIFGNGIDTPPLTISVTYDELFALSICVDAANTYSHRKSAGLRADLTDEEFDDVQTWVTTNERWFITPLKNDEWAT